jgi:hypothetical protein
MNLRGICSVSGKPGLYRAFTQNKSGFILESLDGSKTKIMTNATNKLATLEDITVFGESDDIRLADIFQKMKEEAATNPVPDAKADGKILRTYFTSIAPDHDPERVYSSDIKKIVSWYHLLSQLPLWDETPENEAEAENPS